MERYSVRYLFIMISKRNQLYKNQLNPGLHAEFFSLTLASEVSLLAHRSQSTTFAEFGELKFSARCVQPKIADMFSLNTPIILLRLCSHKPMSALKELFPPPAKLQAPSDKYSSAHQI